MRTLDEHMFRTGRSRPYHEIREVAPSSQITNAKMRKDSERLPFWEQFSGVLRCGILRFAMPCEMGR